MSHLAHRATAPGSVKCCVLTISDTRTLESDSGGRAAVELLEAHGHVVTDRQIVPDEPDQVRAILQAQLERPAVQAIITTGGTGISSRDNTYETITALLDKQLDGFGELFRMLSYQEIGPAAMLSRATAGSVNGRVVLSLPGSEHAVRLAFMKLILPELGHLVREVGR